MFSLEAHKSGLSVSHQCYRTRQSLGEQGQRDWAGMLLPLWEANKSHGGELANRCKRLGRGECREVEKRSVDVSIKLDLSRVCEKKNNNNTFNH